MAQRFVQFVMIQAQNVLYVLGKIPGPDGATPPPNLEAGKMLIDQLEMIRDKTRGNLSSQEDKILADTLSELQLTFVDASGGTPVSMMPDTSPKMDLPEEEPEGGPAPAQRQPESTNPSPTSPDSGSPLSSEEGPEEDKKKFFKSYG